MRCSVTRCYNCICNMCTRFRCPYPRERCYSCTLLEMRKLYDCDYFENRLTAPKRLRIKRQGSRARDELNAKLDLLLQSVGLLVPKVEPLAQYAVLFKGSELFRGSLPEAQAYIERFKRSFSVPLVLKRLEIDL